MITRQEYLNYRRINNYPSTFLWEFYQEKCTENCIPYEEFIKYVREGIPKVIGDSMYDGRQVFALIPFPMVECMKKVVAYYDNKFQITTLKDKEGKELQIN